MKVYNGWIINVEGTEYKIDGSLKTRRGQSYLLKNTKTGEIQSLSRATLLECWGNEITYVTSVAP